MNPGILTKSLETHQHILKSGIKRNQFLMDFLFGFQLSIVTSATPTSATIFRADSPIIQLCVSVVREASTTEDRNDIVIRMTKEQTKNTFLIVSRIGNSIARAKR